MSIEGRLLYDTPWRIQQMDPPHMRHTQAGFVAAVRYWEPSLPIHPDQSAWDLYRLVCASSVLLLSDFTEGVTNSFEYHTTGGNFASIFYDLQDLLTFEKPVLRAFVTLPHWSEVSHPQKLWELLAHSGLLSHSSYEEYKEASGFVHKIQFLGIPLGLDQKGEPPSGDPRKAP